MSTNSINGVSAPVMNYGAQFLQAQEMQAQQYQMQKNAVRKGEMETLKRAYEHFNLKRAEFQAYDEVGEKLNRYLRGAKSALLVWGIIITAISLMFSGAVCSGGDMAPMFFMLFIPGSGMIFGGIMMKVNNKKKCAIYEDEYIRLSNILNEHYKAYPQCPVGAEYANPEIMEVIMGILESGRADTIKEAINVLIAEVNQAEMQKYLQNIEAYAKSASSSASTGAVFAAASFFLK
jgi:hypothetical protein